ncbi:hypothetical protein [Pedobacter frigiditerrae]|uniref:hypothetical protein n=1 Tax=Pedobacter frigiditerrae TaxID=2530452 RepID=UPI00293031EF|nr:hypothetical protein [Pedobacter frigiditerrae]
MKLLFLNLIFLITFSNIYSQNKIDFSGTYKAKSITLGDAFVKVDKENNAVFTVVNNYRYECNCKILNQNTLGCYMVKLLDGRNILNPKAGEFLFAIIYENGNYFPFFRGDNPPFTNSLPADKLIMKKDAKKFFKIK